MLHLYKKLTKVQKILLIIFIIILIFCLTYNNNREQDTLVIEVLPRTNYFDDSDKNNDII